MSCLHSSISEPSETAHFLTLRFELRPFDIDGSSGSFDRFFPRDTDGVVAVEDLIAVVNGVHIPRTNGYYLDDKSAMTVKRRVRTISGVEDVQF